jgi:hypothetical protein
LGYRAYGYVRRSDNGRGIPGLTVRAYDVDWISSDDYLGSSITDVNGYFEIRFSRDDFDAGWWDPEGGPDIVLKVYNLVGRLIYKSPEHSGAGNETYFDIRLNPLDLLGEYTVSGTVTDARSGRALCNLRVEAWDDDFIFDDFLGVSSTDVNGQYLVTFEEESFRDWWFLWEGRPDVYVKIKNNTGLELSRSSTRHEAQRHVTINVAVGAVEISRSVSECVYGWTAAYRQEGTHIIVRIMLNPDSNVTAQQMQNLMNTWRNGIENKWGNHFACCCDLKATSTSNCRNFSTLTFEVQWVTSNPHHTVRVIVGPARSNMLTWDTNDTGDVASHEFGHMLGLVDEYADANCPNRSPVNTGTVMDNNTNVAERQVEHLCALLNENAVPISPPPSKGLTHVHIAKAAKEIEEAHLMEIRKELLSKIRDIAGGKIKPDGKIKIIQIVSGGVSGERYESIVEVLGNGKASHTLKDELEGKTEEHSTTLTDRTIKNLFKEIHKSNLLQLKEISGGFLPDSMVGSITIEIDGAKTTYRYLADPEQRRQQKTILKQPIAIIDEAMRRVAQLTMKKDETKQRILKEKLGKPQKRKRTTDPKRTD